MCQYEKEIGLTLDPYDLTKTFLNLVFLKDLNQNLKLAFFLFYFVSICTKFSNIKLITKYHLTKKKLWHFFSKIELQRQWSCVMCTWQGLFNARGKNFALPPPLTGRNIHSGSKGGVKNRKHKFQFCLSISFFPHFSNWNCLGLIFFQSEHDSLTLSKVLKFLF